MIHATHGSILVCPADRPSAMLKALSQDVREVVYDLEDAVSQDHKDSARSGLIEFLREQPTAESVPIAVRVNDVGTREGLEDVIALAKAENLLPETGFTLVIPKLESLDVAATLRTLLEVYDPGARLRVQLIVESSRTLADLGAIIDTVGGRVTALVFGPGDFLRDMQIKTLRVGVSDSAAVNLLLADTFQTMLVHARAAGLQAIDGPVGTFGTPDAEQDLRASAARAVELGSDAKWAIHPSQVAVINEEFVPSAFVIREAGELWSAYEEALAQGKGAVAVGGNMIDKANALSARQFYQTWKHVLNETT